MKNLFNFRNLKIGCLLIFLFFIYTFFCAISYAENVSYDIADSVFRLHIIANSDSNEDQNLKYKVRDELIEYMDSISINCNSKAEVIEEAKKHETDFNNIASDIVKNNGYDYSISIEIGNFEFPTKTYGDISLPSGYYDALKVKIGEASGENWWCVMFPPLCFIDITSGVVPDESKEYLKDSMSQEDYALVSSNKDTGLQFKFKLLEFFANNNLISVKK